MNAAFLRLLFYRTIRANIKSSFFIIDIFNVCINRFNMVQLEFHKLQLNLRFRTIRTKIEFRSFKSSIRKTKKIQVEHCK